MVSEKPETWKCRNAWYCIIALVFFQFIILFWLRFAARSSPAFSQWWASPFGTGAVYLLADSLWVLLAVIFSRVNTIRGFLEVSGLRRGLSIFGWLAAWVAIVIAIIDDYVVSQGMAAHSNVHNPDLHDIFSFAWCYFILSAVVIAPLCEEVMTRGFLYPAFRGSYNVLITIVIIICFSAYFHWNIISNSLLASGILCALWILLCVVREKAGSLWDCLLCHAVYNLVGIHHLISSIVVMIILLPFIVRPIFRRGGEQVQK